MQGLALEVWLSQLLERLCSCESSSPVASVVNLAGVERFSPSITLEVSGLSTFPPLVAPKQQGNGGCVTGKLFGTTLPIDRHYHLSHPSAPSIHVSIKFALLSSLT